PRSFKERMRYLWKRYGWWALGVYQLWSFVDVSLTFAAIHLLGADHIRKLEGRVREWAGIGKRQMKDEDGEGMISAAVWTELVLAYTIHKTLLLPFRVALTAAVTPAFVKQMVKLGWA
ncbi:hypothetical protein IE81DRAFT_274818, partial [Ceraceosorus guamensis]